MTARQYLIWEHSGDPKLCTLSSLENVEDSYNLSYGVSRVEGFSTNALFRMSQEDRRAIKLVDDVRNEDFLIVASKQLKEFLELEQLIDTEYLRVSIYDHKNRIVSDEYYIIHQVGTQDCIDVKKSRIVWNLINPEQIAEVERLVLDAARIQEDVKLFRAKYLPQAILLREDVAVRIMNAGFSGMSFQPISEYIF